MADAKPIVLNGNMPTIYLDDLETITNLMQNSPSNASLPVSSDTLAYIIYTSGSTGIPKGVAISHGNLLHMADDHRQSKEIKFSDLVMAFSPFCFDASMRDINGALLNGATLYIPSEEEVLPGNLVETLRRQRITYTVVTPSALRACHFEELPSLQTLVFAGEAVDMSLIKKWGVGGRTIINAYGPTEATVCASKRVYPSGMSDDESVVAIGRPTFKTTIYILDKELCPVNGSEIGEIYIGGAGVSTRGYLNLPDRTAQSFLDNPFAAGRIYKSGDLGRFLPNGDVEYLGRMDQQIKLNGRRIEVEEIEACLRSDETVRDAVVTLRGGENSMFLAAYIIASEIANAWERPRLTDHLKKLLRSHLPSYSVPSTISYVDTWPVSAANKILKDALPHPMDRSMQEDSLLPSHILSPAEEIVADILRDILVLPKDSILNPMITYGELGGSSLLVTMVLERINEAFGSNVRVEAFYTSGTSIRELAALTNGEDLAQKTLFQEDLQKRVVLPSDIVPLKNSSSQATETIFLTGATGFLGGHILAEILNHGDSQVTCVVRAKNSTCAYQRVEKALRSWGLWNDRFSARIDAVPGDVGKPYMGIDPTVYEQLARRVTRVWHCAASVNFIASYSYLEEANVQGTIEIMRFASTFRAKKLIYVSTLAVFFGASDKITCGVETSAKNFGTGVPTAYGQTKWVSEQLVSEYQNRGGQVVIMRPGRLLGSTRTGLNPDQDLNVCLFRSFIESRTAPDLDWKIDFTPVDICARGAVQISERAEDGIFHLINPQAASLRYLVSLLNEGGCDIATVPWTEWREKVVHSREMRPLLSMFTAALDEGGRSTFDVLLDNACFRESSYSTQKTVLTVDKGVWEFPAYDELMNLYLTDIEQQPVLETNPPFMFTFDVGEKGTATFADVDTFTEGWL